MFGGDGVGVLWFVVLKNGMVEDEEGGMEIDQEKFFNVQGNDGVERLVGVYGGMFGEREGWKFWRVESNLDIQKGFVMYVYGCII